jgi:hypothetical protein
MWVVTGMQVGGFGLLSGMLALGAHVEWLLYPAAVLQAAGGVGAAVVCTGLVVKMMAARRGVIVDARGAIT